MNNKLIYLFLVVMIVGSLGFVVGVECNADLSQGGNSCTVSSSLLGGYYE